MRTVDVVQGSPEWAMGRLGIPTASRFDNILTPKTRKPSGSRLAYRSELLAEWLLNQPLEWGSSAWTERGRDMEDEARRWYAMSRDVDVVKPGFIFRDDGLVGGSPDGLVGEDGGLEIKCLGPAHHVQHLIACEPEHVGQIQGYLYLTGRTWWDLLYYHPDLPKEVVRVDRDEEYLAAFVPVLDEFIAALEKDKQTYAPYRVLRPWSPEIRAEMEAANR